MEGERADLIIVSTVTTPFDITTSASLQQQETEGYLFMLQNTLIIPTGSSNTSLPLYTLPSMENGNDTAVYVVLELGNETGAYESICDYCQCGHLLHGHW